MGQPALDGCMNALTGWRAGAATDCGGREANEDRIFADAARGIFLVADGMGGHAGGAEAAEIALGAIRASLAAEETMSTAAIRKAILSANNEIATSAERDPKLAGMACVLTVAVCEGKWLHWGHVGDSRLYCFQDGVARKLTADHSPVGELEDCGDLAEGEAMRHPRRHQVSRDVGRFLRQDDGADYVEAGSLELAPDAAFLLCSDGLSDTLTSREVTAIVMRFDGDADRTAAALVAAAKETGGRDNISAVFVAGSTFSARNTRPAGARERHAVTRERSLRRGWAAGRRQNLGWLLLGILMGILAMLAWGHRDALQNTLHAVTQGHAAAPGGRLERRAR